jgi:hypothetical protein
MIAGVQGQIAITALYGPDGVGKPLWHPPRPSGIGMALGTLPIESRAGCLLRRITQHGARMSNRRLRILLRSSYTLTKTSHMLVTIAAREGGFEPRHSLLFVLEPWSNTLICRCRIRCSMKRAYLAPSY